MLNIKKLLELIEPNSKKMKKYIFPLVFLLFISLGISFPVHACIGETSGKTDGITDCITELSTGSERIGRNTNAAVVSPVITVQEQIASLQAQINTLIKLLNQILIQRTQGQVFTVTFPQQDSVLTQGAIYHVTWKNFQAGVLNCPIYLVYPKNGGLTQEGVVNSSQDYFSWTVPNGPGVTGAGFKLRFTCAKVEGGESSPFTIIPPVQNQVSNITIPGMQRYTDSNFGFSFWYPSNWAVSEKQDTDPGYEYYKDGSFLKTISVANPNLPRVGVTIKEFSSPTLSITELGQTKTANPVGVDQKYYFDKGLHTWMYENLTDASSGNRPALTITAADVSNNTMGGLHIFPGALRFGANSIVPLSASHFLIISTNDSAGNIRQNNLVDTIVATDSSVATPWSAALQTQTIQAEKTAYFGY